MALAHHSSLAPRCGVFAATAQCDVRIRMVLIYPPSATQFFPSVGHWSAPFSDVIPEYQTGINGGLIYRRGCTEHGAASHTPCESLVVCMYLLTLLLSCPPSSLSIQGLLESQAQRRGTGRMARPTAVVRTATKEAQLVECEKQLKAAGGEESVNVRPSGTGALRGADWSPAGKKE